MKKTCASKFAGFVPCVLEHGHEGHHEMHDGATWIAVVTAPKPTICYRCAGNPGGGCRDCG